MLRTMIRLPDGSEIFSGPEFENVIRSVKLTQSVNSTKELTLGSVCANMVEVDLQTPNGGLRIAAGDELAVYKVDDDGNDCLTGYFTTEHPTRTTANTLRITAYDRISWLDKDLTDWLAGLENWPYSLLTFAKMICSACGLQLINDSIPNGDYQIQPFSGQNVTGRRLMQWVGEAAGRFCRATPEGNLEFAWYEPSGITLTPGGSRFYYQNGLSFEDYGVMPIEKVQIKHTANDVGVIWPNETGEKNTYIISGNYLLTTRNAELLVPVAQTLYEELKDLTYTPCKVQLPACLDIQAGHSVDITDRNGKTFTTYVMTKTQTGQRDTLECSGSYRRDNTMVVNNQTLEALSCKMLEIETSIEGISIKASDLEKENERINQSVASLFVNSDGVRSEVKKMEQRLDTTKQEIESVRNSMSTLTQTADQLKLEIIQLGEDGVSRVDNTTGSFDDSGLTIDKTSSPTKTQITADGMTVYKKSYNGQTAMLSATSEGVDAINLHAKTYLIIGGRSRFENYGSNRTGCFWIGG